MSRKQKFKARDKITNKMTRNGLAARNAATGEDTLISKREADFDLRRVKPEQEAFSQVGKSSVKKVRRRQIHQHSKTDSAPELKQGITQEMDMPSSPQSNDTQAEQLGFKQSTSFSSENSTTATPQSPSLSGGEHISTKPPSAKSKPPPVRRHTQSAGQAAAKADSPAVPEHADTQEPIEPAAGHAVKQPASQLNKGGHSKLNFTQEETAPETQGKPKQPKPESHAAPEAVDIAIRSEPAEDHPDTEKIHHNRKLGRAQKQADRTAAKLETAKSKLPQKRKIRSERVFDEKKGKAKRKLHFESEVKSQKEHLKGPLPLRPIKAAGNALMLKAHSKLYQVEHENVGVKAAHRTEMAVEGGIRSALHFRKTAPYRRVEKLERKAAKKSIHLAYQKALAENPKLQSNVLSRMWQKRKIKKDYAKAAREAQKAAKQVKRTGTVITNAGKALISIVTRHPMASATVVLVALLLFALMSLIGAFGGLSSGGLGGILTASYLAEDVDIDNAELAYTEWETDLQEQIANIESTRGGYDEYRYNVAEISHNPFELMAYLTVKDQNFSYPAIESDLRALFGEQYRLTFTPTSETRYADPTDADDDGDYEPYEWKILTVTLTAHSFSDVAASHLSGSQLAHYALLLQTKGSRQYVGNPFDINWLPYVTSYYGYRIHPISGVKDLHRGVDIGLSAGTEIKSGQDGTVTFAGNSGDYGNVVVIENGKGISTKYAHCERLLVTAGQTVKMGDVIATVGSTGNSTGAHLHLEVLKDGQYLNPIYFADTGSFKITPDYSNPGTAMGNGTYVALIAEAEKYLGFPYVWGGSNPSTSFDCSGYVSWVLTHSGVKNTGRQTAQGLYNLSTPVSPADARPGDLIFFTGTYSTPNPVTHVGIFVGGTPRRMIHCGDPIQYTSIETAYWQNHFYAFGRISGNEGGQR